MSTEFLADRFGINLVRAMTQRVTRLFLLPVSRKCQMRIQPNDPAECNIHEIKERRYRSQTKTNTPDRLWDYKTLYACETGNLAVSSSRYPNGRTPIECITGDTPAVYECIDSRFYDWANYRQNAGLRKIEIEVREPARELNPESIYG